MSTPATEKKSFNIELGKKEVVKGKEFKMLLVFEYLYCDKNAVINIHKQRPSF